MGVEPTTLRLRVSRSTDCASRAASWEGDHLLDYVPKKIGPLSFHQSGLSLCLLTSLPTPIQDRGLNQIFSKKYFEHSNLSSIKTVYVATLRKRIVLSLSLGYSLRTVVCRNKDHCGLAVLSHAVLVLFNAGASQYWC